MRVAELARRLAGREVEPRLVGQHRHLATQHRDVDVAPFATALTVKERGDDGVGGKHAAADIGDRHAEPGRGAARMPGNAHHAARALHDQVVGRALVIRT